jgi:hypothetical protein
MWGSLVIIQLAYGTSVVQLRCSFVPEIMHGLPPPVKLKCHHMTYTVLKWCKPKWNKQTIKQTDKKILYIFVVYEHGNRVWTFSWHWMCSSIPWRWNYLFISFFFHQVLSDCLSMSYHQHFGIGMEIRFYPISCYLRCGCHLFLCSCLCYVMSHSMYYITMYVYIIPK